MTVVIRKACGIWREEQYRRNNKEEYPSSGEPAENPLSALPPDNSG